LGGEGEQLNKNSQNALKMWNVTEKKLIEGIRRKPKSCCMFMGLKSGVGIIVYMDILFFIFICMLLFKPYDDQGAIDTSSLKN
jgi:hypothetical protein